MLRKWFANQTGNPTANPSPALTKAMLIGGAIDLAAGFVRRVSADGYSNPADPTIGFIPDDRQGFGFLSFARLLDGFANHLFIDQSITLTTATPRLNINAAILDTTKKTRLTLVWTDRHSTTIGGTGGQTYKAVNNLIVSLCKSNGTCWYGNLWAGDGNSQTLPPGSSIIPDTENNVLYVVIPVGQFSNNEQVSISLSAYNLAGDGIDPNGTTLRQDFALWGTNIH